jgi:prepilin signal peptidase PulO-like enzyme (type II secretory pathway)
MSTLTLETTFWENFGLWALQALVAFWFFVLGSVVGSLLNVVAYRMPMRKSLWWPPSSCPVCATPILPRDNIPILGWVLLRGKCRACQAAISSRYPWVEALTGLLFLVMAFVELFSGGANLPYRETDLWTGPLWTVLYLSSNIQWIYLYHMVMLSTLFAIVLIDWDRLPQYPYPVLVWIPCVSLFIAGVYPAVMPVPFWPSISLPISASSILQVIMGFISGTALGGVLFWAWGWGPAITLGIAGSFTGWQFIAGTAVLAILLDLFRSPLRLVHWSPTGFCFLAVLGHLIAWKIWENCWFLPGSKAQATVWLATVGGAIIMGITKAWNAPGLMRQNLPSARENGPVLKSTRSSDAEN